MIIREFFLNFSWTGTTVDTQAFPDGKVPFKNFKKTISLFWQIVNNASKSYTEPMNKRFLTDLMSRAKQRLEDASIERKRKSSSGKTRPKNLKYNRSKLAEHVAAEGDADQDLLENTSNDITEMQADANGDESDDLLNRKSSPSKSVEKCLKLLKTNVENWL